MCQRQRNIPVAVIRPEATRRAAIRQGRYPGGGGGIPFPRRGKKKTNKDQQKQEQEQLHEVSGVLRKLEDKSIVVEAKDTRIINLKLSGETKYSKNGEPIKSSILKPGDHLRIDASQDEGATSPLYGSNSRRRGPPRSGPRPLSQWKPPPKPRRRMTTGPVLRRKDSPADKESTPERSSRREEAPARGPRPLPRLPNPHPLLRKAPLRRQAHSLIQESRLSGPSRRPGTHRRVRPRPSEAEAWKARCQKTGSGEGSSRKYAGSGQSRRPCGVNYGTGASF